MTTNEFITGKSGTKYYYNPNLTIGRYIVYERLSIELATAMKAKDYMSLASSAEKDLSSGNDLLAAVMSAREKLRLIIGEAVRVFSEKQMHPMLAFCALFMNAEKEDIAHFDPLMVEKKIIDWIDGGVPVEVFFSIVSSALPEFAKRFKIEPDKAAKELQQLKKQLITSKEKELKN